jgi:uncharacterized protein YjbI with pentapeptide repeats
MRAFFRFSRCSAVLLIFSSVSGLFAHGQSISRCGNQNDPFEFYHEWAPAKLSELSRQTPDDIDWAAGVTDQEIKSQTAKQEDAITHAIKADPSLSNFPQPFWLWYGEFSHARLAGEDLCYTMFHGANLTAANLAETRLEHANFTPMIVYDGKGHPTCYLGTRLNGAIILNTKLAYAQFGEVDLQHAVFEPVSLPDAASIASARNLQLLTFASNPAPLVQLRKLFQDSGFQQQSREITYALERRENELNFLSCCPSCEPTWPLDSINPIFFGSSGISHSQKTGRHYGEMLRNCLLYAANRVGLDLTCQYGMNTLRPIKIGSVIWLICALIFLGFIHHPGSSGLYLVRASGIVLDPDAIKNAVQIRPGLAAGWRSKVLRELGLFREALFFSLMNGVNLGFRDIDFGRWLRLLPRREVDIRAVGWARTVAGVQALCTLYLVALWILFTFAPPIG